MERLFFFLSHKSIFSRKQNLRLFSTLSTPKHTHSLSLSHTHTRTNTHPGPIIRIIRLWRERREREKKQKKLKKENKLFCQTMLLAKNGKHNYVINLTMFTTNIEKDYKSKVKESFFNLQEI